jgi:hypothetical protein
MTLPDDAKRLARPAADVVRGHVKESAFALVERNLPLVWNTHKQPPAVGSESREPSEDVVDSVEVLKHLEQADDVK